MTNETASIELDVSFAWWLRPYLSALVFFAVATGSTPDFQKLQRVVQRAIRIRVI